MNHRIMNKIIVIASKILSGLIFLISFLYTAAGGYKEMPGFITKILDYCKLLPLYFWQIILYSFPITIVCLIFNKYCFIKKRKTRIAFLMPMPKSTDIHSTPALQDGERQLLGIQYFKMCNNELNKKFHIDQRDHEMNKDLAFELVKNEIKNGTKYFICTMSDIAVSLSSRWDELLEITKKPAILLCTIASAPTIAFDKKNVYRFYIRSNDEAIVLVNARTHSEESIATWIVVDDDYGRGALTEFLKSWKGGTVKGIKLCPTLSTQKVSDAIHSEIINKIREKNIDTIFIAHYANGLSSVISAVKDINSSVCILATSTLTVKDWRKGIDSILCNKNWITCFPELIDNRKEYNGDIICEFVNYSLQRFSDAIMRSNYDVSKFDVSWRNSTIPSIFKKVVVEENGDCYIEMQSEKHIVI